MFVFLILGLLAQHGFASDTNQTGISAALKVFESIVNKNFTEGTVKSNSQPDILTYIHNLHPSLLQRPDDPNVVHNHPLLDPREDTAKTEEILSKVNENRRFINWLKNFMHIDLRKNNNSNETTNGKSIRPTRTKATKKLKTKHNTKPKLKEEIKTNESENPNVGMNNRRFISWFKNLFARATTTTTKKPTTSPTTSDIPAPVIRESRENPEVNLNVILEKINNILEKFNKNIEEHNLRSNDTTGFLIMKVPIASNFTHSNIKGRRKREVTNTTEVENQNLTKTILVQKENYTTLASGRRLYYNDVPVMNTNYQVPKYQQNEEIGKTNNIDTNSQFIRKKLITFIAATFKDIKEKIGPLKTIKDKYTVYDAYVIGYIMASVDTLEVNLTKVLAEMEMKKNTLNETNLMELFERINKSNKVITKLIDFLKRYSGKRYL